MRRERKEKLPRALCEELCAPCVKKKYISRRARKDSEASLRKDFYVKSQVLFSIY
jgi:hypothetical protein